jgi:simple sugar transport system permease protein
VIEGLFTAAVPLTLASLGALFSESAGMLGIFIEGFIILGSFFSWILAGQTGSVFAGCLITALLMACAGWGLARFVHRTGVNPFIAGLALNLAAGGIVDSLSVLWFNTKGVLRNPGISVPGPVHIPLLRDIPLAGPLLSGQSPFVYLAWGLILLSALGLGKTRWGLRLRASGLSVEAAEERGLRPRHYRETAWAAAALLAALAGAALSFRIGAYTPGGSAGRGWIALAAVFLGFRRVWGTVLAALVFTLAERIGLGAQAALPIPATALLGLPPALALLLYSASQGLRKKMRKKAGS